MHDRTDPIDFFKQAQAVALARHRIAAREHWLDIDVIDGGKTHIVTAGEGPPILLINGIGVPAAMMAPLIGHLDQFTVHAVDLPGYGLTDTTPSFADELRNNAPRYLLEVIDGLGLERPTIVANSLGSLWSSWLAIDHPGRVAALAHIGCPAIVFDTSAPLPMRLLSAGPLGPLIMKLQPPSPRQVEQLAKMVNEHPLPPEIADLILATEQLPHYEHAFLSVLRRLVRLRGNRPDMALTAEQLARIDVPTLLVFAANDPMGAASIGRRMVDTMPDAEFHMVDGGHAPWIHHADQIAAPLTAFLERVNPRDAASDPRSEHPTAT